MFHCHIIHILTHTYTHTHTLYHTNDTVWVVVLQAQYNLKLRIPLHHLHHTTGSFANVGREADQNILYQ